MSADNWRTCPRCRVRAKAAAERLSMEAAAVYGKVAEAEYSRLVKRAAASDDDDGESTFREDYELGVNKDGVLRVSYHGKCERCGFRVVFKHEAVAPGLHEEAT